MLQAKNNSEKLTLNEEFKILLIDSLLDIPTADNVQPFRYHFKDECLYIYHNKKIAKHKLNPNQKSSLISYGCMKTCINIVSSHSDLLPIFDEYNTEDAEDALWAIVSFKFSPRQKDELLSQIPKRVTNRGLYQIPTQIKINGVRENLDKEFDLIYIEEDQIDSIANNDQLVWKDAETVRDLLSQINLIFKKDSGLNFENLYVKTLDRIPLIIVKRFPFLGKIVWPLIKCKMKKAIQSSSYVLVYYSKTESNEDYIKTGEKCYRQWLKMTELGLVMQPLTSSTYAIKVDDTHLSKNNTPLHKVIGTDREVAWAFRVGIPEKRNLKSNRLKKSEVTSLDSFSPPDLE